MTARRKAEATAEPALGSVAQLRARLDQLRAEVGRIQAEFEHEAGRPVPMAEIERRVDEALNELRRDADGQLMIGGLVSAGGSHFAGHLAGLRVPPLSLAAVVVPEGLRGWLLAQAADALTQLPEPVDAPIRHTRLTDLRRRLLEVEWREADLLWAAEEQGVELPWRSDIDPAAVLGLAPDD